MATAAGFMIISNIYTTVAYFLHERVWSGVKWGLEPQGENCYLMDALCIKRRKAQHRGHKAPQRTTEKSASLSVINYFPSPASPLCAQWLFSAFSVLNSEKRN